MGKGQSYSKSLSLDTTMEIDCHKRSVDRYIKVKKGNVLLYGVVNCLPFLSNHMMINFIVISGSILHLGC